jgi:hypothetical protein
VLEGVRFVDGVEVASQRSSGRAPLDVAISTLLTLAPEQGSTPLKRIVISDIVPWDDSLTASLLLNVLACGCWNK